MEEGATRNFQAYRFAEQEQERQRKEKEEEELNNPMKVSLAWNLNCDDNLEAKFSSAMTNRIGHYLSS